MGMERPCDQAILKGEQLEFELLAREVRRRAGLHDDDLELATRIAGRLLGPRAIALEPKLAGAAYLRKTKDGWQIVANPRSKNVRFHIAHELGEWALRTLAQFDGDELSRERAANYIAAAILAPESALRKAHARVGEQIRELASQFQMSQTAIVLRLAEITGDERAVVTKTGNVLIRTQGAFPWGDVPILEIARGATRWRGLRKANLSGALDVGRVALRAR